MDRSFVVTGGPGTGKSTLVDTLAERGHPVVREVARDIILKFQRFATRIHPDEVFTPRKAPRRFRRLVVAEQYRREAFPFTGDRFIDVGLPENVVYARRQIPLEVDRFAPCLEPGRYDGVFLLERPSVYELDGVRHEGLEEALEIDHEIREIYEQLGYRIVTVPLFPRPQERADFVLSRI